jgi:hypothetical protein
MLGGDLNSTSAPKETPTTYMVAQMPCFLPYISYEQNQHLRHWIADPQIDLQAVF